MYKVAINGFGRIGKMIARSLLESSEHNSNIELVTINDLGDLSVHAHLFKYDSVHGTFNHDVCATNQSLKIDDHEIKYFSESDTSSLPWAELDIDLVFECTGRMTSRSAAAGHLIAGSKKVIISAPSSDADKMIVFGVNHGSLTSSDTIISNASCTTNCLAPIVNSLHADMDIYSGIINTVHAATNDQNILDNFHSDPYRARSSFRSLIPTKTGAASAIGCIIPELKGKLTGMATRVPVSNVSMLDFTFCARNELSLDEVKALIIKASKSHLKGILATNDNPLVSIDFNGNTASSIVDLNFIDKVDNQYKIIAWYDNEFGFANRMLDLASFWLQEQFGDNALKRAI